MNTSPLSTNSPVSNNANIDDVDWGMPEDRSSMARETKIGVALIASLLIAFGVVVYQKIQSQQELAEDLSAATAMNQADAAGKPGGDSSDPFHPVFADDANQDFLAQQSEPEQQKFPQQAAVQENAFDPSQNLSPVGPSDWEVELAQADPGQFSANEFVQEQNQPQQFAPNSQQNSEFNPFEKSDPFASPQVQQPVEVNPFEQDTPTPEQADFFPDKTPAQQQSVSQSPSGQSPADDFGAPEPTVQQNSVSNQQQLPAEAELNLDLAEQHQLTPTQQTDFGNHQMPPTQQSTLPTLQTEPDFAQQTRQQQPEVMEQSPFELPVVESSANQHTGPSAETPRYGEFAPAETFQQSANATTVIQRDSIPQPQLTPADSLPAIPTAEASPVLESKNDYPAQQRTAQFSPSNVATGKGEAVYKVQPNDNYWRISKKRYGTIRYFMALAKLNANRVPDPKKLKPGMLVQTPEPAELEARFPELFNQGSRSRQGGVVQAGHEAERPLPGFFFDAQGKPKYRVGAEDTLSSIAHQHLGRGSRWVQIFELNRDKLGNPDRVRIGTILTLPADASQVGVVNRPGTFR